MAGTTTPPYTKADREHPETRIKQIVSRATYEISGSGMSFLANGMRQIFAEAVGQGLHQVAAFAAAMDELEHSSRTQMQNAHYRLGQLMQFETLKAYDLAEAEFGRQDEPYRTGAVAGSNKRRYAGGRLRKALESDAFFYASHNGISFGNLTHLNAQARQWHRLNFGAGGKAALTNRSFDAMWQGLVVASVGFEGETPSAAFMMPKGVWGGEGRRQFFPTSKEMFKQTKGIKAWQFFDAGPKVLAENLGRTYEDVYDMWWGSAQRGLGPLSRVTNVPILPPRLTPVREL